MIKLRTFSMGAALATLLFTGFAHAETFSFSATSEITSQISMPMLGGAVASAAWVKASSSMLFSKRGEVGYTADCASTTNPRFERFDMAMLCEITEKDGASYGIFGSCNYLNKERTEMSCVGGLAGKTGAYKDRRGTISWHSKQGASPTLGSVTGAGLWNE